MGDTSQKTSSTATLISEKRKASRPHSAKLLKIGYYSGLIAFFICLLLSLICISSFLYSTYFWLDSIDASKMSQQIEVQINGRLVMARIALLSCGIFAGISFGFLGFSLFLLGIEGSSDAGFESSDYKITLSRMSPGVIVIIVGSILIGICATKETPFWYEKTANIENEKSLDEQNSLDGSPSSNAQEKRNLPPKMTLDKP